MSAADKNTFRPEVLVGNHAGDFGEIRLLHTISGWSVSFACLGIASGFLLLFAYGSITKNVLAAGVTETLASGPASAEVVATVFVPVTHAAALTSGQRVTLHYDAYPYQKYGVQTGIVRTIDAGFVYADGLPPGIQGKLRHTANSRTLDTVTYRRMTLTLVTPEIRDRGQTHKVTAGLMLDVSLPQASIPLLRWLPGSRS